MGNYYIGIDLGGTNIKGSIFDKTMKVVAEDRIPTEAGEGPEHVLNRMKLLVDSMIDKTGLLLEQMDCMGIGVPGLLDPVKGISLFSPNFINWENIPVARWFEDKLKIPVFIDNDVRVNLYGEWNMGAGIGSNNLVLLTLGTGLGSGIVMDGHVIYGATASAGEVGHMNMYREGRPCRCGSSGCLSRYVSVTGMLWTVMDKIKAGQNSIISEWVDNDLSLITGKMVSEAYDLGDVVAIETLHETGEVLGYGLANIINLYNPEKIIIGGGMAAAGDRFLSRAREIVEKCALRISREACVITTAYLGDAAGMVGAAIYAKQKKDERISNKNNMIGM